MRLMYICSPLRGGSEKNIAKTNEHTKEEAIKDNCAITPHCAFTQFLSDEVPDGRWLGQEMGKALLCGCDGLLVYGSIISEGMRGEVKITYENGIIILSRNLSTTDIESVVFGETEQCRKMIQKAGEEQCISTQKT